MKTALSFPTLLTATILVFLFAACVVAAARADEGPPKTGAAPTAKAVKDVASELEKAKQKLAPTYTLAYKFAKGDEVRTKVVHLVTVETKVKGATQTAKTRTVSTKLWRIKEIDSKGQIIFEHVVEHVDMWNAVSGRQEVRYDSASSEKPPPGYETVASSVGKVLATVTMDAYGRVYARTNTQPQFNPGIGELSIPFPNTPVKVGTTWSMPDEIKMKLEDGVKKVQTRQQYKLEKVELGVATISVDTQVLTPVNDPKIQAELVQRLQHGTIKFDLDAGRLIHKQMDMDEEVFGFSGADSHMQYLARFTEEPLRKSEQTARKDEPATSAK